MRALLLTCGILITSLSTPCPAQHVGWRTGYGEAISVAEQDGLPMLLHFHAWYCGPCQRMDRDVFPDPEVQQALRSGISAAQIDVSREPDLASQYGASTVPRDVVVFPDGTTKTLNIGYMSKSSYMSMLRGVVASVQPRLQPADKEPLFIGLDGYCPVQLHDKRKWTPGLDSIVADYREIRYRFASDDDRATFLKNPAIYAPQDLGCDPILLTSTRKAVTGSIRYGAFFDRKLYLFQSAENRDLFKQTPLKYTQIRSALKAEQIEGTRFY